MSNLSVWWSRRSPAEKYLLGAAGVALTVATGGAAAIAIAGEGGIVVAGGVMVAVGKTAVEVAKRVG